MCYRPHLKVFQHVLNHVAPRFPLGNLLFSSYRQGWTPKRRNSCRNHPILGKHEKSTTNRISKKIKKNLGGWTTQRKVHSPISAAAKNGECHETRWGTIECFSNDPIIKLTDIRLREICAIKRLAALRFFQLCLKLENPQKKHKKNPFISISRSCSQRTSPFRPGMFKTATFDDTVRGYWKTTRASPSWVSSNLASAPQPSPITYVHW